MCKGQMYSDMEVSAEVIDLRRTTMKGLLQTIQFRPHKLITSNSIPSSNADRVRSLGAHFCRNNPTVKDHLEITTISGTEKRKSLKNTKQSKFKGPEETKLKLKVKVKL
jgi:hypothetical protein